MFIILLLTCVTTIFVIIMGYQYLTQEKQVITERMSAYTTGKNLSGGISRSLKAAPKDNGFRGALRYFGRFASAAPKVSYFDEKMLQADIPMRGSEFIVLSLGLSIVTGLMVVILTNGNFLGGVIAGLIAYLVSIVYVNIKIARRITDFNNQLGDVLGLMANALRSGFSFMQAVEMVSKEMAPPVSQEFGRVLREMNLGVTTEDSLGNLTRRIASADLEMVVTAVLIQRQVGGNLAQILDSIATTIRERILMKGEVKTLTAQGRLSGWVVGLIPIFLIAAMNMINPGFMDVMFEEPLGRILLIAAVVSQIIGGIIIRRIVSIEL